MELSHDNRKVDGMQILEKFVFPAVVAALSAVFSVQLTLSTLELDVNYIKRDVERQSAELVKVTDLQLDVIALQIEVKNGSANMSVLSNDVNKLRDRLRQIGGPN